MDEKLQLLKAKLAGKYLSVLGDSISTYQGYSNCTTNNSTTGDNFVWFPSRDVDCVQKTYWHKLLCELDLRLLVNNSVSGSKVFGSADDETAASNKRCENLHADKGVLLGTTPDVLFVYMGINDVGATDENADEFAASYTKMMRTITRIYPFTDVFAINLPCPSCYSPETVERLDLFNSIIEQAATQQGAEVIRFRHSIADNSTVLTGDGVHPNQKGMDAYCKVICDKLYDFYCVK